MRLPGRARSDLEVLSTYQYQNLAVQNEVRLLKLLPSEGDRIDCELHHFVLGSPRCPQYRAVSYTWGDDAARHILHLPRNAEIRVRRNLKNALLCLRDRESFCWLWIDAICINQQSDREKGHQVRLMADIYGGANVVQAWLQSAGENPDVAKAFQFVHNAVTFDNTEQSVHSYCAQSKFSRNNELTKNWRAVLKLCRLRYWTRKWIIQELVLARTVVLQRGDTTLAMADLEEFCGQLDLVKDVEDDLETVDAPNQQLWKSVLGSPAARLALQRLEANDDPRTSLLHDLVVRYAGNQCRRPCDHVYALYSLVGPHRTHLSIEYEDTDVKRLVDVLDFVQAHERVQPSKVLGLTHLLVNLFRTKPSEFLLDPQKREIAQSLDIVVPVTMLGTVALQQESAESDRLRRSVATSTPIPTFNFDTSRRRSVFISHGPEEDPVGRMDMAYFRLDDTDIYGLAACRLQNGDAIWRFKETLYAFAVRHLPGERAQILGRAHMFSETDLDNLRLPEHEISLDLATLLSLSGLAVSITKGLASNTETGLKADYLKSLLGNVRVKVELKGRRKVFVLVTSGESGSSSISLLQRGLRSTYTCSSTRGAKPSLG